MAYKFFDQYSVLHFAVGIIMYFWGVGFYTWFIIHLLFELSENSPMGITFINNYFKRIWPGGKFGADGIVNSTGDIFFGLLGWLFAYSCDYYGAKYNWYPAHIKH